MFLIILFNVIVVGIYAISGIKYMESRPLTDYEIAQLTR